MTESPSPRFRLFEGGLLPDVRRVLRLTRPPHPRVTETIAASISITWVPLILLSLVDGKVLHTSAAVVFDVGMAVRFLVSLPLLLSAPRAAQARLGMVISYFIAGRLLARSQREKFVAQVEAIVARRDSRSMVVAHAIGAYAATAFTAWVVYPQLPMSWRFVIDPNGERQLSLAGWWAVLVSQPLYFFVLLRFVQRVALWWKLLWRVSGLQLRLNAAHPDGAGGLAFLSMGLSCFTVPAFAIAASVAGNLADLVLAGGVSVSEQKFTIVAFVATVVTLFAGPLLFFSSVLSDVKRHGALSYGTLARRQLRAFERKWLIEPPSEEEALLAMTDSSAAADFNALATAAQQMSILPFGRSDLVPLVIATSLPFLPIVALEIPVRSIVGELVKLIV